MIPGHPDRPSEQSDLQRISAGGFVGFLGQPSLERGARDTETAGGLSLGQSSDRSEPFWIDPASRSAKPYALLNLVVPEDSILMGSYGPEAPTLVTPR